VMMSFFMALGVWMQQSELGLEMLLGSLITRQVGLGTWLLGFVWHLFNGGIFALIYMAVFKAIGQAGLGWGVAFGIAHWVLAGILLGMIYSVHPIVPVSRWQSGVLF